MLLLVVKEEERSESRKGGSREEEEGKGGGVHSSSHSGTSDTSSHQCVHMRSREAPRRGRLTWIRVLQEPPLTAHR